MIKKQELIEQLKNMGIKEGDTLLVHSSMKAIGDVDGGADTVLDALIEVVCGTVEKSSDENVEKSDNGSNDVNNAGMLVLPTHTWASMTDEHSVFDPEKEPACVGILPNLFMKREGVVRSLHPTHSLAAYSLDEKKAGKFAAGEERFDTPCNRQGCYGKLYDLDAKILLLGVGLNRNTYMHGVEEWFGIKERLTEETLSLYIKIQSEAGKEKLLPVKMHKHFKPNNISISENYERMRQEFIEKGALVEGKIGEALCSCMSARKVADITTEVLRKNRDFFL